MHQIKLKDKTKFSLSISLFIILIVAISFSLFFGLYYIFTDIYLRDLLLKEADEIERVHLDVVGDKLKYNHGDEGITIRDDLERDNISAIFYNSEKEIIGAFGVYEYQLYKEEASFSPSEQTLINNAISQEKDLFSFQPPVDDDEPGYKVLFHPISYKSSIIGVMQLAIPVTQIHLVLNIGRFLLIGISPLIILLSILFANLQISSIFRPIHKLIAIMEAINITKVNQPVTIQGHRDNATYKLSLTFNKMIKRIEEGVLKQKEFISNASHELKHPLARISSNLEVARTYMEERDLSSKALDYIKSSEKEAIQLGKRIDALLALAKVKDTGIKKDRLNLRELITKLLAETQTEIEKKRLNVVVELADIIILSDEHLFNILLSNLWINCIKYVQKSGEIQVKSKLKDDRLLLIFKNSYTGSVDSNKLTERFYRGDNQSSFEGMGVGLSMVKDLCNILNLDIAFKVNTKTFQVTISATTIG